jgi:hypothetical protein
MEGARVIRVVRRGEHTRREAPSLRRIEQDRAVARSTDDSETESTLMVVIPLDHHLDVSAVPRITLACLLRAA